MTIASKRADVFSTYAKYIAVLAVAGGIVAFLVFLGYWLLKKKPEPKIITSEKIIERPIKLEPKIYITDSGGVSRTEETRISASERVRAILRNTPNSESSDAGGATPVINFTLFKEIPLNQDGIDKVIIGMKYTNNEAKMPSVQWCYVLSPNIDGTETRVSLANKYENSGLMNQTLTYAQATKAGTSLSVLKSAQSLCTFL